MQAGRQLLRTAVRGNWLAPNCDLDRASPASIERLVESAAEARQEDATLALAGAFDAQFAFSPIDGGRAVMLVGPPGSGKTTSAAKLATTMRDL